MRKNLRNSGIDIVGNVPFGTHFCQFYQTKEDLMDTLVPYFKAGLESNEFCMWVTSQPLEVEKAKEALRKSVPDLDIYLEKGQIEIIPYACWYLREGVFDSRRVLNGYVEKLDQALANGYDGLRLSENTFWVGNKDWNNFVNYEKEIDRVIGNYHMISLSTYPLDRCSATKIIEVVSNHQFSLIKKEGKWEREDNFGRKEAEEATALDIEDWEQTFDAIPDLIAILDTEYRVVRANRAMAVKLGMTPEECIGQTCYQVIHGKSKPPASCPHRQLLKDGAEHTAEVCEDCLGGYFIVSVSPLYDSKGKLTGSIHVARDINERKQEEHRIHRYNRILGEINRIFSNVVQAKTEKELGNACLSVALEMTGSQIGFIGEVGTDGILHDIAISESGWDQCLMYDKTGHRYRPGDLVVHGLYGSVVNSGKSFFTNDPPSHFDSIGVPKGHPPLMSFLGVPLVQDGKTIGVLAVANHEGGYSCEQQEDLEAIAPAVTQALQRKKAEQERKRAEEALIRRENEFRTLAENSPDMIARFDRQNRHIYVNPAAAEVYDLPQEEIIGKTHSELGRNPKHVKFWERHNEKVFTTGNSETIEFHYTSPQGEECHFNTRIVPEFIDGKVTSVLAISRDITDIKEAEAKLKETLDNLENLVKERTKQLEKAYNLLKENEKGLAEAQRMAHLGNWDWNLVTGEIHCSDELYRIFGLNPQEFSATYSEALSYIHPDDRDSVNSAVKKALDGNSCSIDFRIILADQAERIVHSQGEIVYDEKNIPVRIKGIVQDITERKRAEEKIQILANAVESSDDAIITKSLDGIITSWNKGAEKVYGYSAEEVLGKPISILEPSLFGGETKKLTEMVKQGERIHHYETVRLRKDGMRISVSMTLSPVFDIHGNLAAISSITRDITESKRAEDKLRESEEKYRNIVETANEGVLIIDDKAVITYANKKMTDMSGYSLGEGIGRPVWDFISEESKAIAKLNLEKRRQGANGSYELKLIREDGSPLWVLVNAKSLFDKDGKFAGSLSMLTDVTERKKTEETLANIEIARKKEIHHRIKNNLQVISSLLDLQAEKFNNREDIKDSEVLEAFRESQDRVISMALIHEELYRGGEFDTLDFSSYIEELTENLFLTYRLGNTDISLNMDLEENIFFDMDTAVPLGMIINELVSNSFKYAFQGRNRGEIQIKLRREEKGKYIKSGEKSKNGGCKSNNFALTVSDNGVGIPEYFDIEDLDSLGFQLITSLIDQLDGRLELKRNSGTEFTVRFTVKDDNE
jgi:PAS domain S-box-containing protein